MKYNEFIEKVASGIRAYFGEETRVEVKKVTKNNGVILDGIIIMNSNETIAPTIYMETFYREYQNGKMIGDIILEIITIYKQNRISGSVNLDFFMKYESVKGRVFQKVINYEKNKKSLENVPHIRFLDLAVVCYYAYMNDFLGNGSIQIEVGHLDQWGISEEELFEDARRNTYEKLGLELKGMDEILIEMLSEKLDNEDQEETNEILNRMDYEIPMYVMTLRGRYYGAACICYQEYLQTFAKRCKKSFYILPSSIHELILIPDSGREKSDALQNMVHEVNITHVSEEEQLSDNIYYFNISDNQVSVIQNM